MTPDLDSPEEGIPDWSEGVFGAGVPVNGVDPHAVRRAHMREQTTAKQAAERRSVRPTPGVPRGHQARLEVAQERAAELHVELARLDAQHQAWLRVQGFVEAPLLSRRKSLPPDIVADAHPADVEADKALAEGT